MIEPITKERWQQAQSEEIKHHNSELDEGITRWNKTYANNFKYLNIKENGEGKTVIEVGCGSFPALLYQYNVQGIIIEPLNVPYLKDLCIKFNMLLIQQPLEEADVPTADEIWLFNVMQHIIDPELFVSKCKDAAKMIRFFEPIDYPISDVHPHSYSLQDFKNWFGDCVKLYNETNIPNFHDGPCAYGVWDAAINGITLPGINKQELDKFLNSYK